MSISWFLCLVSQFLVACLPLLRVQNVDEPKKRLLYAGCLLYGMERIIDSAIITSSAFHKVVYQHFKGMIEILYKCWKFHSLSSSERILKIGSHMAKLLQKFNTTPFETHCRSVCYNLHFTICTDVVLGHDPWLSSTTNRSRWSCPWPLRSSLGGVLVHMIPMFYENDRSCCLRTFCNKEGAQIIVMVKCWFHYTMTDYSAWHFFVTFLIIFQAHL